MSALPLTGVPGKMTRRLAAMTLFGQGLTIALGALVARQLAVADGDPDQGTTYLFAGLVLAVLAIVVSGLLRRPWGVTAGWGVQVLTFASAVVLLPMVAVGVIFTSVWVLALTQGTRMDELTAQWHRDHPDDGAAAAAGADADADVASTDEENA